MLELEHLQYTQIIVARENLHHCSEIALTISTKLTGTTGSMTMSQGTTFPLVWRYSS
jgi:hypothetical protein